MADSARSESGAAGGAAGAATDPPVREEAVVSATAPDQAGSQASPAPVHAIEAPIPAIEPGPPVPPAPETEALPEPSSGLRVSDQLMAEARMAAEDAAAEARIAATRAADAASVAARSVASRSARAAQVAYGSMQDGLRDAKLMLAEEQAAWDRVAQASALPGLSGPDAMSALAERLDREAAFWRAFAIDRMRPAAPRAIAVAGAAIGAVGAAALGTAGAIGALFGSGATAAYLALGGAALAVGVLTALACAAWLDRTSTRATQEALARADRAERTLHRVAAILALAGTGDAERHREALARFERG